MLRRIAGEFRGLVAALLTAAVLGSIVALVVYFSPLKETMLDPLADFTFMLSVFAGGWYSAYHFGNRGLVRGVVIGVMFFVFMLLVTLVLNPAQLSLQAVIKDLLFGIVCGGLGGILGVGMAK